MPSWPQDCVYYFVFLHVSHCFTDGVGGSDCWQHPTKNRQHEIITSWWRLSPQKKKQNKLQDEAKSLPTKSKQTNRYTNKPNHPWTPNHFGIFNFSKRILEKKKKHTRSKVPKVLWVPHQQKEKADRQPLPLPYLKNATTDGCAACIWVIPPKMWILSSVRRYVESFLIELTTVFKSSWIGTKNLTHLLRVSASVTSYLEQPSTETKQK